MSHVRILARTATIGALSLGLASCFAVTVPVLGKGERLPFEGEVTCTVAGVSGPPVTRGFDTAKPLVAADGSVGYAADGETLTVRKAPSGLWLAQLGRLGRYQVGYLAIEGQAAKVLGLAPLGIPEAAYAAARVRAIPGAQVTQLMGEPADVEAFLLARTPAETFPTGTCRAGKPMGPETRLFGPYRRSTTKAEALALPGASECDGGVCIRAEGTDGPIETEARFAGDGTLRHLRFDVRRTRAPVPREKPDAWTDAGTAGVVGGAGMQPIGIVIDGMPAYLADPGSIDTGLYQRIGNIGRSKDGIVGALRKGYVKRFDTALIDDESRARVAPGPSIGAYLTEARNAGGVTVQTEVAVDKDGHEIFRGTISQLRPAPRG